MSERLDYINGGHGRVRVTYLFWRRRHGFDSRHTVEVGLTTTTRCKSVDKRYRDQVAGAQWDLVFDPDRFTLGVVTRARGPAAGKSVSSTILSPGVVRV